jgi:putative ABC transport system substrate-binding protein
MKQKIAVLLTLLLIMSYSRLGDTQETTKPLPRIGFIFTSGAPRDLPWFDAFQRGLRDLGYVEGKNVLVERRYAEGRLDRMSPFVQEFVQLKVDVIIGTSNVVIRAAKEATKTIPIVMISSVDPVAAGYVESFARPGGNITGLAWLNRDISAKRVELLKELLPKLSKVGILWDTDGPGPAVASKEYTAAAQAFKLDLRSLGVSGPNPDFPGAFQAAKAARLDALIVVANPLMAQRAKEIFDLAAQYRLPSMTEARHYVEGGGLLCYGANVSNLYRRAATYVDAILKGAKPANLMVEQPSEFELLINGKTAQKLGLEIPRTILLRANEVIE